MSVAILGLIFEGEQVRGGQGDTVDSEKVIYPKVALGDTFWKFIFSLNRA